MRTRRRALRFGSVAAAALLPAWLLARGGARADIVDPSVPHVVVVGAPRGHAPTARVDGARSGRSGARLPERPVERWRRQVSGGLVRPPAVDASGNVFIATTTGDLLKIGPDGRDRFRVRMGGAGAASAPTLLSDGTVVVISAAAAVPAPPGDADGKRESALRSVTAYGVSPAGKLRFATPLGVSALEIPEPLARSTGGVVVAVGSSVYELGVDGLVRARVDVGEPLVGSVVEGPDAPLVTGLGGAVYAFEPPGRPRRLGSFGGVPRGGAALSDARTLVAVVDGRRLAALDLRSGVLETRGSPTDATLEGPPALRADGTVLAASATALLGFDARGDQVFEVPFDKLALLDGGAPVLPSPYATPPRYAPARPEPRRSPPLVVDPRGTVAFARSAGKVGVATRSGRLAVASEQLCIGPNSLQPAGESRFVVACNDGTLVMLDGG